MRLDEIDPTIPADQALDAIADYLGRLALQLSPAVELGIPHSRLAETDLHATVQALARYAARGLPVWDWETHEEVADGLSGVVRALYVGPVYQAQGSLEAAVDGIDPVDELDHVLVGALARLRLGREQDIGLRELGVLAGLGAAGVRHHIRGGELAASGSGRRGDPQRIDHEEARRWLGARGVPGIAPTPLR